MFYAIYKTTNRVTGKFYIGKWQSSSLEHASGSYLGSGKLLRADIKRYGRSAFDRVILFVFESMSDAIEKEREIVTKEFCARSDTYNMALGGSGSFAHVRGSRQWVGSAANKEQQRAMSAATASKRSQTLKTRWATDTAAKERQRAGIKKSKLTRGHWGVTTHSTAARKRIAAAMKAAAAAGRHPCAGTRWMVKDGQCKKVPSRYVQQKLADGWTFGRG